MNFMQLNDVFYAEEIAKFSTLIHIHKRTSESISKLASMTIAEQETYYESKLSSGAKYVYYLIFEQKENQKTEDACYPFSL